MPISESKRRADEKWRANNLEQIAIRVHKGTREEWKQQADRLDTSLAGLIVTAVTEYLKQHPDSANHPDTPEPDTLDTEPDTAP